MVSFCRVSTGQSNQWKYFSLCVLTERKPKEGGFHPPLFAPLLRGEELAFKSVMIIVIFLRF